MPSSIIAAGLSGLFAGTTISGMLTLQFGFSFSAFASSLVMSGLSAALRPDAPEQQQSSITSGARTVTMRQPIMPWRVIYGRTRVGGGVTYKKVTGNHNLYNMVITLAGHPCESIDAVYFGEEEITLDGEGNATGKYAGHVVVQTSLGTETGQPFPYLVQITNGEWSDAHRQTGCTKVYLRVVANNDLFPNGLPNVSFVVKGKNDIYDPRTGLTGYSANPALCINNYLTDTVRGIGAVYASEINATELVAAANVCDESVTLADGTTEPRYTCNGTFSLSEKPVDIIPKLASSMAGYVVNIGAAWSIHAGAYDTPTLELTESDLAGAISWQSLVSRRDSCNGVKGVYVEPGNLWQPGDFPAVVSDTARAEDNGEAVWHDLRLEFTDSGTMAQRIGKIDLLRTRQPLTVSFPGKLSAFRAVPGKTVLLTIAKYGWSSKPFWVAEGTFAVNADGTLGYHLSLRETAPEIYDWSTDEESPIDLAPNTDLGDPFTVEAPGTPDVVEALYETTGSAGVKARATMSWAASSDAFLLDYLPEYRIAAGTWVALPPTADTSVTIDDIAPGTYEFRLRARGVFLSRSDYSGTRTLRILGLTAAPADVSGFSIIKSAGFALASWTLHPDLDVRQGGSIVVRHSPLTTGAAWENGIIIETFPGSAINGSLALMTGTYMAKALDSSGNYSAAAVSFVATEGTVTGWSTVATTTQQPDFTGTNSNTAALSGVLQLSSVATISSMTEPVSAWPKISALGGLASSGSYEFDAAVDLGTVATRRYEADIAAVSFDTGDLISFRGLVSSWSSVTGAAVDDCDATLYIATTDDDPAGTPTWSAWVPFFVADFTARAAKFKLDLASGGVTHNIAISTLAVDIKEPA
jgi:hypothetical protein